MCGGTPGLTPMSMDPLRSIPACAGEPRWVAPTALRIRSIPACAGEPGSAAKLPRRSGGSIPACAGEPRPTVIVMDCGLSPRVRGNPCSPNRQKSDTVYPRVCGGTVCRIRRVGPLYPRVCGGTICEWAYELQRRSIPACAGEPGYASPDALPLAGRSIPACAGEPRLEPAQVLTWAGLSPRVRGNPVACDCHGCPWIGSIPACAGEPHLVAV